MVMVMVSVKGRGLGIRGLRGFMVFVMVIVRSRIRVKG